MSQMSSRVLMGLHYVVVRMSILDTKDDGSIPSINMFFFLEQETLSALLQSTQL